MVVHDIDSGQSKAVDEVVTTYLALTPQGICFLNARDNNTLYRWDEAAGTVYKLSDVSASALFQDESFLWLRGRDHKLYRCAYDGGGLTFLEEPGDSILYIPATGETFYYLNYMDNTLCQGDKRTMSIKVLE